MNTVNSMLEKVPIPKFIRVKQNFKTSKEIDVESEILKQLSKKELLSSIQKGQSVCLAVGSRDIHNQVPILKCVIQEIKKIGGKPFIVPAMGSHGGAMAKAQKKILENMGIGTENLGAPIRSTMDVVRIGTAKNGLPVYIDTYANKADWIIICNKIKPHVSFRGPFESGLMKMLAIGLGNQKGAETCHSLGFEKMKKIIPAVGKEVLERAPILSGIGIVEDPYHKIHKLQILKRGEIADREPPLLEIARKNTPRLYFDSLDVLVIDEIGKNISGTGVDNAVIGRYFTPYASGGPDINKIVGLNLSDETEGNGNGVGILDFITKRIYHKLSFNRTYINSLTSTLPQCAKIPMMLKTDRQAIQAAIKTCNIRDKTKVKMVRIKNSLTLEEIEVSESLQTHLKKNTHFEIISKPYDLPFNKDDNL
jgi:hypothetical protein